MNPCCSRQRKRIPVRFTLLETGILSSEGGSQLRHPPGVPPANCLVVLGDRIECEIWVVLEGVVSDRSRTKTEKRFQVSPQS